MTKFKKEAKRILTVFVGALLLFNAGFDFARWNVRKAAERGCRTEMMESEQIADVSVRQCFAVADVGWLCDVDVTLIDGRKGRMLNVYNPDDAE